MRVGALLLLREFLRPLRQLIQLLHGIVDFLLALLSRGRSALLLLLILVLLRIQLEVKEVGQIAAGIRAAASTPASAIASEGYLNIAIGSFGALQVIQGLFLRLGRVLGAGPTSMVRVTTISRSDVSAAAESGIGLAELIALLPRS